MTETITLLTKNGNVKNDSMLPRKNILNVELAATHIPLEPGRPRYDPDLTDAATFFADRTWNVD